MKPSLVAVIASLSLLLGVSVGFAAKYKGAGIDVIRGKSDKDAALAALGEAEHLANGGSWELIAVARVYYLTGDKARGQALFDSVTSGKAGGADFERIAGVYAEAGENDKATAMYEKMLAIDPKDDSSQAEVGAWYIRIGQRDKGEELLARAFARNPDEVWYYVRAGESYLGAPVRRKPPASAPRRPVTVEPRHEHAEDDEHHAVESDLLGDHGKRHGLHHEISKVAGHDRQQRHRQPETRPLRRPRLRLKPTGVDPDEGTGENGVHHDHHRLVALLIALGPVEVRQLLIIGMQQHGMHDVGAGKPRHEQHQPRGDEFPVHDT